ncbi:MAG: isoleucine--tRNA ligase, partial [Acidobacteria bacterium]|nr:isoleucine--tRNA ligase [Acidobacteriota bacterium]
SVTMDELWRTLPGTRVASVHMALFPMGDELAPFRDPDLLDRWAALRHARDVTNVALEEQRTAGEISSNLSAQVDIYSDAEAFERLTPYRDFLPTLFGVSEARLHGPDSPGLDEGWAHDGGAGWTRAKVKRADGVKCERCWRYVPEVSTDPATPGLCARCVDALAPAGTH